jgi:hypothetical protein
MIGREEAGDFGEDGSSVAAEGEEEWNEEDSWSDAEDNGDIADEAQEYLDFLAQQVTLLQTVIDKQTAEYGAKLSDGRDDEWEELEEQLREEPLFTTPLDKHDPYITFTQVFTRMSLQNSMLIIEMEKVVPAQINAITSSLSMEEQKLLHSIVQQAKENEKERLYASVKNAEREQIPALNLNGN